MIPEARLLSRDDEPQRDHYVRLFGVSWADYETLDRIRGDRSRPKIAYFDGTLELMTTSRMHERVKSWLGSLVEAWCLEHDVDLSGYGGWTLKNKRKKAAAEPDECYVVGRNAEAKSRPDIVIEVVLTSGGIDKLAIYHALQIHEVWFWDSDRIQVYARRAKGYEAVEASEQLVGLDLHELLTFLDRPTMTRAIRDYQKALRKKARKRR